MYREAGETLYLLRDFERAAFYFDKAKDYAKAINCYDLAC
jgi:hypothetical protein